MALGLCRETLALSRKIQRRLQSAELGAAPGSGRRVLADIRPRQTEGKAGGRGELRLSQRERLDLQLSLPESQIA